MWNIHLPGLNPMFLVSILQWRYYSVSLWGQKFPSFWSAPPVLFFSFLFLGVKSWFTLWGNVSGVDQALGPRDCKLFLLLFVISGYCGSVPHSWSSGTETDPNSLMANHSYSRQSVLRRAYHSAQEHRLSLQFYFWCSWLFFKQYSCIKKYVQSLKCQWDLAVKQVMFVSV